MTTIWVAEIEVTVAGTPLKLTTAPWAKFVPARVTGYPPKDESPAEFNEVRVGAKGVFVTVGVLVAVRVSVRVGVRVGV
jgi:hypothetical protein